MAIQHWSDDITVAELADDPEFTDEMEALTNDLAERPADVVLNFGPVSFLNSSNIAKLLRLRRQMLNSQKQLILCAINSQVWGVFQAMGLDKIFESTDDVATALATVQLSGEAKGKG